MWRGCAYRILSGAASYFSFLDCSPIFMAAVSVTTYKAVSSGREVRRESRWLPWSPRAHLTQRDSPKGHVLQAKVTAPRSGTVWQFPCHQSQEQGFPSPICPGTLCFMFYNQLDEHYQRRQQPFRPAVPAPNRALGSERDKQLPWGRQTWDRCRAQVWLANSFNQSKNWSE